MMMFTSELQYMPSLTRVSPNLFSRLWRGFNIILIRTHQVVNEKSSKYVSSKPNQSVLYFYVERIVTTLSTVYISALKQTTIIRIKN